MLVHYVTHWIASATVSCATEHVDSLIPRPSRAPARKDGLATIEHLARPYDVAIRNVGWLITAQHSSIICSNYLFNMSDASGSGRCLVPRLNAYLRKTSINAAIGEAVP